MIDVYLFNGYEIRVKLLHGLTNHDLRILRHESQNTPLFLPGSETKTVRFQHEKAERGLVIPPINGQCWAAVLASVCSKNANPADAFSISCNSHQSPTLHNKRVISCTADTESYCSSRAGIN